VEQGSDQTAGQGPVIACPLAETPFNIIYEIRP
jgi:hypothetical protein